MSEPYRLSWILDVAVMPAKAGIYDRQTHSPRLIVDPRLREDDGKSETCGLSWILDVAVMPAKAGIHEKP